MEINVLFAKGKILSGQSSHRRIDKRLLLEAVWRGIKALFSTRRAYSYYAYGSDGK